MRIELFGSAIAFALLLGTGAATRADTTITGEKLGAFFRITVPDAWNGDLVIVNHGHSFDPPALSQADLGPLAPLMLSEGYAIAASSYSQCCWTLFTTQQDLNRLLGIFEANFGPPNGVLLHGFSLGGIVTAQGIEKLGVNVVGAYPVCGALSGSRSWDGAIDLRLVYDAVCTGVPGGTLPGGATGLPSPGFPTGGLSIPAIATAVNACTGVLTPPAFRTPAQQARLSLFESVTQIPESFVVTDMVFATNSLSNLIFAADKLAGGQGVGNVGVTYNDATIDANIQRVAYDSQARHRLEKYYIPKGDVGATKIVSLHTDGDGLVIVENEEDYADKVPAANLSQAIVDEAGNTHCGFNAPELVAGWESLRGWLAGGPQPTAASIQGLCQFIGPASQCRIDPAFVVPEYDNRIPPR
jgi:hypothetical protein